MVVPISGGYDSRGILLFLRRHKPSGARLRAVTWGTQAAPAQPGSDAHVARELCRALGVEHRYHVLGRTDLGFAEVFRRFVAIGEGRTDNIGGYVDGFALWRELAEEGVACVLRGDMAFGYPPAVSERDVRLQTPIPLLDDFENLRSIPCLRDIGMPRPEYISRRRGESCSEWNARLGHEFRLPTTLAALTHLKVSFVEVLNPLLARPLVECARTLPRRLSLSKSAYKILVRNLSPPVPFARTPAIAPVGDVCGPPDARAFLRELLDDRGRVHLPSELVEALLPALAPEKGSQRRSHLRRVLPSAKWAAKTLFPPWMTGLARSVYARRIAPRNLALRAAIVTQMCDVLEEDARVLGAAT
jgi:hypothetical protein